MLESRHHPLAPRPVFLRRVAWHTLASMLIVSGSLFIGVLGYHELERLPWLDALLNASMLMGGMGPVDALHTDAGKLFASAYALYCGLVLLVATGILFAPLVHRVLHRFHAGHGGDA